MTALETALRSLDHAQFERLVFDLLKARYPTVDIKRVHGAGGDQGIDSFAGFLDDRPTIWQCKSFPNGVGSSQKTKIKASLNRAVETFAPRRWVLCLPIDLSSKAHLWFERLQKSNAGRTEVGLDQGSVLIRELMYRHTIREHYFPAAILNPRAIREALAGTSKLTTVQLGELNDQNMDDYLARLQELDARYTYRITFARDTREDRQTSGALFTLTRGSTTIEARPRDHDALALAPPTVNLTLTAAGRDKLLASQRTGQPSTLLAPGDITDIRSDFDFLVPNRKIVAGTRLEISTAKPDSTIPLKVCFGSRKPVKYDYVEFRCSRAGTEEALFESVTKLPFGIRILRRRDGTGSVTFVHQTMNSRAKDVQKFLLGMEMAASSQKITFYDLQHGRPWGSMTLTEKLPDWFSAYRTFIEHICLVEKHFNTTLPLPSAVTVEDVRAIERLKNLVHGKTVAGRTFTFEMSKGPGQRTDWADKLLSPLRCRITLNVRETESVFGISIPLGKVVYDVPQACVQNGDSIVAFLRDAPVGATIKVTLEAGDNVTARKAAARDPEGIQVASEGP